MILMKNLLAVLLFTTCFISARAQSEQDQQKAVEVFDEGASLSMKAEIYSKGNKAQQAFEFNKQAIAKFKEVLTLDPNHPLAPTALAHSYYLVRDYQSGAKWYQKVLAQDSSIATAYREYGLCKVNLGDLKGGKQAIEKSFKIDPSSRTRKETIHELYNIGTLAFKIGDNYEKDGNPQKGNVYRKFSISVLLMAYEFNQNNTKVIEKLVEYMTLLGDKKNADYFRSKL